jgi:hypothetical protein
LLIIADILLFWIAVFLDPQGFDPAASGDFHLPHRDPKISMGSWVAVKLSGKRLPSRLETPKPFWAVPSCRASVSGAPKVIASRGLSIPRSSRDITSSSK